MDDGPFAVVVDVDPDGHHGRATAAAAVAGFEVNVA